MDVSKDDAEEGVIGGPAKWARKRLRRGRK